MSFSELCSDNLGVQEIVFGAGDPAGVLILNVTALPVHLPDAFQLPKNYTHMLV